MMLSVCHQLSNSQMYHRTSVVQLSDPVALSYADQNMTIFVARCYEVQDEGETDTNHIAFIDLFEMPKDNTTISLSLCLFVFHCLSLLSHSPALLPSSAHPHSTLIATATRFLLN